MAKSDVAYAVIIIPVKYGQTVQEAAGSSLTYQRARFIAQMGSDGNMYVVKNVTGPAGEVSLPELLEKISAVLQQDPLTY